MVVVCGKLAVLIKLNYDDLPWYLDVMYVAWGSQTILYIYHKEFPN